MRQTKKGNQWYFGMKDRVGTNTKRGLVNKIVITDASVHDSQMMNGLIQEESIVY